MSNASTVSQSGQVPSAALGNATSETQFVDSAGNVLTCYLPLTLKLAQQDGKFASFKVKAGGRVTTGTTSNWTPKLYWGNSSTIASNSGIAAPSAVSLASVSQTWHIEATCFWDTTSQRVNGWYQAQIGATTTAPTTLTTAQTSKDLSAGDSKAVGFSVTGVFGSTDAGNTAYVDYLTVEVY